MLAAPLEMNGEPALASFRPSHIVGIHDGPETPKAMLECGGPVPVTLEHVSFCYPGAAEPALKDICLEIPAGSMVAVTGPVGSGKSALARALLGLYPLETGAVRFGASSTPAIGYLSQEPFLFSGTVRENILFGVASAQSPDEAVTLAAMDEDVRAFPGGLDTQIGEMGVRVSGGQRQRIALARALAAFTPRSPSLLVLDDPFSAVDVDTEARIIAGLRQAFGPAAASERRATIVLCSHRLAVFPHADFVVVLGEGHIQERGSHADLIAADGLYARIYSAQRRVEVET
jgi:ABC-type multidrug transport system fused ATPase/permease subunit